jgi:homeobox protein cut-like
MEEVQTQQSDAERVLDSWKTFNISEKRIVLDQQYSELKEAKGLSITGRKKLNEATKLFRSKTKVEQAETVHEILKAYQDEIDQLSRRSKSSESAFVTLYKSISECLDPIPVIENLLTVQSQVCLSLCLCLSLTPLPPKVAAQNYEIQRLRSELSQYDLEFQQLKNQDVTIRRLETQIADYKETIDEKVILSICLLSLLTFVSQPAGIGRRRGHTNHRGNRSHM